MRKEKKRSQKGISVILEKNPKLPKCPSDAAWNSENYRAVSDVYRGFTVQISWNFNKFC